MFLPIFVRDICFTVLFKGKMISAATPGDKK